MQLIDTGCGELFMNPDPDEARQHFRYKNRKQVNKVTSLKSAVSKFIKDGDYIGIGGFGANRTPIAACHEILRQGRNNLGFAGHTATHDMQILSAGKVFDRLDIAYVVGLEARGLSLCARKYVESGLVRLTEWTNYSLSLRLQAAAMGIPFLPARNLMGTDTFRKSAAKISVCPFTGKKIVLLPALYPDVAVIHVHEADIFGNSRFRGIAASDIELAKASKRVVITTEKLISNTEIRRAPSSTLIPYHLVDAVCEVPYGAYPGTMPYEYFSDEAHLRDWMAAEKEEKAFRSFLKKNIFDCSGHEQYTHLNGGITKMGKLRAKELLLCKETAK